MLVFDLAIVPVLPTIVGLLDALAFRHLERILEGLAQIRPEDFGYIAADQGGRGAPAGQQHALCVDHKHIAVVVDEFALPAEGGKRLVAVALVVGQGFFQQRLGRLGVFILSRCSVHLAETQQQQPGESEQSLHYPSLVLVDVTRA